MDASTAYTVASIAASCGAGWITGRRSGKSEIMSIADNTINILTARSDALDDQVKDLKDKLAERDTQIADLNGRVNVLAELATQRAEVAAVKVVVDAIAIKVGATIVAP